MVELYEEGIKREQLERVALDVRKEVTSHLKRMNLRESCLYLFFGECGYAAWKVVGRLKREMPDSKIKIYSFNKGFHYVVGIGDNFENSWKIDPVLRRDNGNLIDNVVISPYEEYPLAHFTQPKVFALENFKYFVRKFNEIARN